MAGVVRRCRCLLARCRHFDSIVEIAQHKEHVARAENLRARLDALDLGRLTGRLTPEQVADEYRECVQQASFL